MTPFYCPIDPQTELRLIAPSHAGELWSLLEINRDHLRPWHPWVDTLRLPADIDRALTLWQRQETNNRGFYAGIWHQARLCGMINHLNVDWPNRCTALSYWLDEAHQGRGIMTASCQAMITHSFDTWQLNRITIECATDNLRSRAVAERLGFKLEGIVRQIEWLQDHFADHALYGRLRSDSPTGRGPENPACALAQTASRSGTEPAGRRTPAPPVTASLVERK